MDASQFLPPYNPCRRSRYPPSIRIVSKIPVMKITMHLEKRDATLPYFVVVIKDVISALSSLCNTIIAINNQAKQIMIETELVT